MRRHRGFRVLPLAFVLCLGGAPVAPAPQAAAALADGIAPSNPESIGFSSDALKDLDAWWARHNRFTPLHH